MVPVKDRTEVLKKVHNDPFSGHLGVDKTTDKIRHRFYWPKYLKDVAEYIQQCDQCALVKAPKNYTKQPIVPIRSSRPFRLITWDILGPLPRTESDSLYILVIVCHFSKFVELFPLKSQKAEEVADCLIQFICRHGVPEAALSDRGTNFQSELMNQLYELLDIQRMRTSAYHPQCDGETERFNRTLEQMLACYVADSQKDWDKYLPKLAFAYNTAVHHTTGVTPFEVIYGRKPKLPVDLLFPAPDLDLNLDLLSYASKVRADLLRCYETVAQNADVKVSRFKFYADRNVRPFGYALGDRVYLLKQANKKGVSKKLSHKWKGPFTVVEVLSENNYLIRADANQKKQLVHANRLKRCFKPPSNTYNKTMIEESVNSSGDVQADWSPEAESQVTETNEEHNSAAEINPDTGWIQIF